MRCAEWARSVALDPIGTAPSLDQVVLVEWPLPWPAELDAIDELAAIGSSVAGRRVRLQVVPPDPSHPGSHEVCVYERTDDEWFRGYASRSVRVSGREVVDAATELLACRDALSRLGSEARERRVMVCTHGRRDVCCGAQGARLASALELGEPLGARVVRTSHLSGHRFAPTSLMLPEGTMWAHLTAGDVRSVLAADGPLPLGLYRGCCGLDDPAVQALERWALADVGGGLFGWPRQGRVDGAETALVALTPDGETLEWRAPFHSVEQPASIDCGAGNAPTLARVIRLGEVERAR